MKIKLLIPAFAILFLSACKNEGQKTIVDKGPDPLIDHIDSSYKASQDFFMFCNNGWFQKNPIPASEGTNGIFRTIQDDVNEAVKKICESSASAKDEKAGSNKQKIGDFYSSGMDSVAIEKAGIEPLSPEFKMIDEIKNTNDLIRTTAYLHKIGAGGLMGFYVNSDDKISSKNACFASQGGLGLPQRDYYFDTDSRTTNIRKEYISHLEKMFVLAGSSASDAKSIAQNIFKLETALAKSSRKLEDLRDPYKNYNKMSVADANKITPQLDWVYFGNEVGAKNIDTLIIGQPEFFKTLNDLLKATPIEIWKQYCRWQLLNSFAGYLSKPFDDQNFYFYGKVLSGQEEQKPRWKRVVEQTDGSLGEIIGQVYVAEYLPKGSKEKLLEIGNNIRDVYADRIKNLDWMSDVTKQKALSKLNKIIMKVGYPDKWKDMSSMQISKQAYVRNVIAANIWGFEDMTQKYGKPVDRTEWQMYPQTYNAYYNPSNNEIVVPACNIYVPGFELADDAVLYGIIGGSTFGHEITHGFDDQGSQYDENGNLSEWWTKEDKEKFLAKTKLIVEQFNEYKVLDSLHVNGDATQGENIADLGGLVMGLEAFKKTKQYKDNEIISGLTPIQRYFMGYAYAWMVNRRPEGLARQIKTDVHSPAQFRINGPVSDMTEFYEAFNVKPGDAMYRPDSLRVKIW